MINFIVIQTPEIKWSSECFKNYVFGPEIHIHTRPHVCAWRRWLGRGWECLVWAHCIGCARVSVAVVAGVAGVGAGIGGMWLHVAECSLLPTHRHTSTRLASSAAPVPCNHQPPRAGIGSGAVTKDSRSFSQCPEKALTRACKVYVKLRHLSTKIILTKSAKVGAFNKKKL